MAKLIRHDDTNGVGFMWETSDGDVFDNEARAQLHQDALDGTLAPPPTPLPVHSYLHDNGVTDVPHVAGTPQVTWVHGEGFIDGDVPDGDAALAYDPTSNRLVWRVSPITLDALNALTPQVRVGKAAELRRSREVGDVMVTGVVQPNHRRPAGTREQRVDLQPLVDRAKALVITIANLDVPTDGQVAEITKSVASIQAERDRVAEQLAELDGHLSMGRAIVLAHSDPRSVASG